MGLCITRQNDGIESAVKKDDSKLMDGLVALSEPVLLNTSMAPVWPSILAICCFNVVFASHLYGYQTFI